MTPQQTITELRTRIAHNHARPGDAGVLAILVREAESRWNDVALFSGKLNVADRRKPKCVVRHKKKRKHLENRVETREEPFGVFV